MEVGTDDDLAARQKLSRHGVNEVLCKTVVLMLA